MKTTNHIIDQIERLGLRRTPLRMSLLECLLKFAKPLAVTDLLAILRRGRPSVNKTTVYREVERLSSVGLIKKIVFGDGKARYEAADLPHHHHLVCRSCEGVTDVHLRGDLDTVERGLAKKHGFIIEGHSLEFFGLCSTCR